jgi:Na+/proline symporter
MLVVMSIVFFIGILVAGILAGRKLEDANQWANGGRNLNWFTAGMLVVSFQIGGTSIIGSAQYGYTMGIAGAWYSLAGTVAIILSALFAKVLRKYVSEDTLTNFLENRYNASVGTIYSTVYLLMGFIYIPIQLFTVTTIIRTVVPGLSLNWACVIGLLLSISYIIVSGIKGAGLVSKITMFLMYITIAVGLGMILGKTGGFAALHSRLPESYFSLFTMPTMTWIGWFITIFVAFLTMQAAIQPTLSCRDDSNATRGVFFAALLNLPIGFLCAWIGMAGKSQGPELTSSSLAFASTVNAYVVPWLSGMIFAGIGLIIVCTLAGQMLAIGTIIRKVLKPLYTRARLSDEKELLYTRLITFGYAFLTIIPTFMVQQAMLTQLVTILVACVTGPMFFSIVAGMYWKKVSAAAAKWSMFTGIVVGIGWVLFGDAARIQPIYLILGASGLVGFIVTLTVRPKAVRSN